MKIKYLFFYVFLILSIKCTNKESSDYSNVKTFVVDQNKIKNFTYSTIFKDYELICFTGDNSDVLVKPEKILVNEFGYFFESSDAIYFYDNMGKFKSAIKRKGTGPGEYLTISDFIVDLSSNTIEINDGELKKILRFNFDGEFIDEYLHHMNSYSFAKVSENNYLLNSGRLYNDKVTKSLTLFNVKSGENEIGYNEIEDNLRYLNFIEYTNFANIGDTLSYSSSISNKIFAIDNKGMYPRIILDFKSNNLPNKYFEKYRDLIEFVNDLKKTNYVSIFDGYQENSKFIFLSYSYQNKRPFLIIDKNKNNVYNFNQFEDDLLFPFIIQETGYNSLPCLIDDNYFYVFIDSYKFIELFENHKNKISSEEYTKYIQNKSQIFNVYKNISPEDNPILIKYKLQD